MLFLHTCLKTKLTKYLSLLVGILLFSTGRVLLSLYLQSKNIVPPFSSAAGIIIGIFLSVSVYLLLFRILVELKKSRYNKPLIVSICIISIQLIRTVLYYLHILTPENYLSIAFTVLVSAYLFFIGLAFYKGIKQEWNPAVQKIVKQTGFSLLLFGPISAFFYISLFFLSLQNTISLDFVFMGICGFVTAKVLIEYLSRIGSIPSSAKNSGSFIDEYKLSSREAEVLMLVLEGMTNKEIGEKLFISYITVRTHISHIFEKTGTSSRIELFSKVVSEKKEVK
ncbi:MAG TPA: helix-turn-helix transcriptional regulator [Treponemataceae bacterium]|nr:helix-turn-helix transcriptional regulator [Treponemataceae bacterium]HQL04643.1 helix-turn-helix transcriptional regulator [Treponemataceae bacterium]